MRTIIIILLLCSAAYAVNLEATGYDYIEYTHSEKTELVASLYKILKIDKYTIENGVNALDGLYYTYYQEVRSSKNKDEAVNAVFSRPVMNVIADILNNKQPGGGVK